MVIIFYEILLDVVVYGIEEYIVVLGSNIMLIVFLLFRNCIL